MGSSHQIAATTLLIENDYGLKRTAIRLGVKSKTIEDHYLDLAVIRKEMGTSFRMPRMRLGGG